VTGPGKLLIEPEQDEIFAEQRSRLARLPQQIEADLEFWQPKLEEAQHALEILRPGTKRFSLIGCDLIRVSYFSSNRTLSSGNNRNRQFLVIPNKHED
jgi:hypothetical protein